MLSTVVEHRKLRIPLRAIAAGGVGFVVVACGSSSARGTGDVDVENAIRVSCTATVPPTCSTTTPHYADVAPILQKSCVPCHPGPAGATQWPLTDYADNAAWAGAIQDQVCANTMPPLDGGIAIAPSESLKILDWVQCGAPE
jgi:hypothetical protein